jgi:hypothetical protein
LASAETVLPAPEVDSCEDVVVPVGVEPVVDALAPGAGGGGWFAEVAFCATATPIAPAVVIVTTADARNFLVSIVFLLEGR